MIAERVAPAPEIIQERFERYEPEILSANDVIIRNTGWLLSPPRWRENKERRAVLKQQTTHLATMLEQEGISAFVENDMVSLSAVTRIQLPVESYRTICFLPLIAQRDRRETLNALRYFHSHHPLGEYLRMSVITYGVVFPVGADMKAYITDFNRDISRWGNKCKKIWGVQVLFRALEWTRKRGDEKIVKDGVEYPSLHERDPKRFKADVVYYHLHANILYTPVGKMEPPEWRMFLIWSRDQLGNVFWKDCGRLRKPEEALKYPFKPAELDGADSKEIAWLYKQTSRSRIVECLNTFRDWRSDLENNVKLDADGNPEIDDKGNQVMARKKIATVKGRGLQIIYKAKRDKIECDGNSLGGGPIENMIVFVSNPQFGATPYAESCIIVKRFTENPTTTVGHDNLATIYKIMDIHLGFWKENGGPDPEKALAMARWYGEKNVVPIQKQSVAEPLLGEPKARPACPAQPGGPISFTPVALLSWEKSLNGPQNTLSETVGQVEKESVPVPIDGKSSPRPRLREVSISDDGTFFDPETGEVIEIKASQPVRDDRILSAISDPRERACARKTRYYELMWRRKRGLSDPS